MFQNIKVIHQLVKNIRIGLEMDSGTRPVGVASHFKLRGLFTLGKGLVVNLFILLDLNSQFRGEGVDNGDPNAMKAAGYLVPSTAKFTAGVQNRQCQLNPGLFHFVVHIGRNTTAVIHNGDTVIFINGDHNILTVTRQRLIDGVIHDFIDKMVEPLLAGAPDIHPRSLLDRLKAFQHLYLVGSIIIFLIF